jgi:hypothetical protein
MVEEEQLPAGPAVAGALYELSVQEAQSTL